VLTALAKPVVVALGGVTVKRTDRASTCRPDVAICADRISCPAASWSSRSMLISTVTSGVAEIAPLSRNTVLLGSRCVSSATRMRPSIAPSGSPHQSLDITSRRKSSDDRTICGRSR
jgi:hypothetical protein